MDYLKSTTHTIAWFRDAFVNGQLDLEPVFQRNPVWKAPQKSFLIDTILRGYPIPELYVQESVSAEGEQKYTVVDGQQRIRACLEFLDGEFALGAYTPRVEDEQPLREGDYFEKLPAELKKRVWNYDFVVRTLPETSEAQLRAIFRRLNRNVFALNSQELRHATYFGGFISLVEEMAEFEYWGTTGVFTPNDVRRMLDVEFVAELTIGYLHGPQNKKVSLDKYFAAYEEEFSHEREIRRAFTRVTGELREVLPDISTTRWSKKSDFYTLFLALAPRAQHFPLTSTQRRSLARWLRKFAADVDSRLSDPEAKMPVGVRRYALAVQRAASDLQNRKARQEVVEKELLSLLRLI